jgi:hypothetical protein
MSILHNGKFCRIRHILWEQSIPFPQLSKYPRPRPCSGGLLDLGHHQSNIKRFSPRTKVLYNPCIGPIRNTNGSSKSEQSKDIDDDLRNGH